MSASTVLQIIGGNPSPQRELVQEEGHKRSGKGQLNIYKGTLLQIGTFPLGSGAPWASFFGLPTPSPCSGLHMTGHSSLGHSQVSQCSSLKANTEPDPALRIKGHPDQH